MRPVEAREISDGYGVGPPIVVLFEFESKFSHS